MAKVLRNGRNKNPEGQYTLLTYRMLQSGAFRGLSGSALKLPLELCTRFSGANNGDLSLSLAQAATLLGIGKSTAYRAYKELETKGFIKKVTPGSWIKGMATTWRITFLHHQKNGRTNEWRDWQPIEKEPKQRRPWGNRKQQIMESVRNTNALKTFLGTAEAPRDMI